MVDSPVTEPLNIRGPVGDWNSLKSKTDYRADWQANGGSPSFVESAGLMLRAQTEGDLKAGRWGLLAWENPRERSRFKPFWIDEEMLVATIGEEGDPTRMLARATGMSVSGLRLLDGALVLKLHLGRRLEQIRVLEGDSFDMERTPLRLLYPFDGFPPEATARLWNLAAITDTRKPPSSKR